MSRAALLLLSLLGFAQVSLGQLRVTTTSLPNGTVLVPYSANLAATGGNTPYRWSIVAGTLPVGLALNGNSGSIGGTPSATSGGAYPLTVQVRDRNGDGAVATADLSITINQPPAAAPVITTASPLPAGVVGVDYSATIQVTGGTAPMIWTITDGVPPPGLNLANLGNVLTMSNAITGRPTTAGTYTFTVKVSDITLASATKAFTIVITGPPSITTTTLSGGTAGTPYSVTLAASAGTPPYTWTVSSGSLPPGINLTGTTLAGTPTAPGTYNLTLRVTDSAGLFAERAFSIVVSPAALSVTSTLPNPVLDTAYSQTLTAAGGTPPYTWALTSGTLPPGLSLSTNTIAGTPNAAGTFTFTLRVTDSTGANAEKAFSLTVPPAAISITTATLPGGIVGQSYTQTLAAAGGTPPFTWSLAAGTLPAGLSLTGNQISGVPTAAGTSNFTVRAADQTGASAQKAFSITISAGLAITTTTLPGGAVGVAYPSTTLNASGGTAPYTWTVPAGSLPPGLTLSSAGQLSGTPTSAGSFPFTAQVRDSAGLQTTAQFTVVITAAVTVGACPSARGVVGQAYAFSFSASGGTPPFTWSISTGAAPSGILLDSSTGSFNGTPTQAGAFTFTVRAADSANASGTRQCQVNIDAPVSITTSSLPDGVAGAAYSQTLTATGGTGSFTWTLVSGSLPAGLTLSPAGAISGTPTAAGTSTFRVQAKDAAGAFSERDFTLNILSGLAITACPAAGGVLNQPYSSPAQVNGGRAPYSFTVSAGELPAGLTLATSGALSGTPTAAATSTFTLSVTDAGGGSATRACSISVTSGLTITTASLPNATARAPYSQPLTAVGGVPPYIWTTTSGSLPPGLVLTGSGQIAGTPSSTGSFPFTVKVTESSGTSFERALNIVVVAGLSIAECPPAAANVGQAYSGSASAAGGEPPLAWSLALGALPNGLVLNAANGSIAGTPSEAGPASFSLRVADQAGAAVTRACTITVNPALSITTASIPDAVTGTAYRATLAATGGTAPYTWSIRSGTLPPGLSLAAGSGQITGTPAQTGTFTFVARVTDASQASAEKNLTIATTAGFSITECPAAGVVGQPYSSSAQTAGGQAPLTWAIVSGNVPAGLTFNTSSGAIAGTPTAAGSSSVNLRATDQSGASATRACTLAVTPAPLAVSDVQPADAVLGVTYSQSLRASGGAPPYAYALVDGRLPEGVSLSSAGQLTGTPRTAGSFPFSVRVTDQASGSLVRAFTLNVLAAALPELTLTGPPDFAAPAEQYPVRLTMAAPYPADLTGRLVLSFIPDPGADVDDPAIQFASGGRVATFAIPAGQTEAAFAIAQQAVQTGTVAGTIDLRVELATSGVNLAASSLPRRTIRLDRRAPKITDVQLVPISGGMEVRVTGFATTREVNSGTFRFTPRDSSRLPAEVTVPMTDAAKAWYQDPRSAEFGSQFRLVQPFTLPGGIDEIGSVSVSLTNTQGSGEVVSKTR